MTITPALIYWINVFDGLGTFFNVIMGILILIGVAAAIAGSIGYSIAIDCNDEDDKKKIKNVLKFNLKWYVPFLIFFCLGTIFIPDKETMYKMIIVPPVVNTAVKMANSADAEKAAQAVADIPVQIDKYLKKLSDEKK